MALSRSLESSRRPSGAAEERGEEAIAGARGERKRRTRDALIEAALTLMGEGRSFTSLGLREITRVAGVVPTSFYRHFPDTEQLGLALVEESGLMLRRLLREVRTQGLPAEDMIRRSVQTYKQYILANKLRFLFVAGERSGGAPAIRAAIRSEITHFTNEMAADLRALNLFPNLSTASLQMICGLVVNTMLSAATDILDLPADAAPLEREQEDTFVQQMRVIFFGAMAWRERLAKK